jgi:hypothetical protein
MKNCNGRPFFSMFCIARANQKIPNLALGRESRYSEIDGFIPFVKIFIFPFCGGFLIFLSVGRYLCNYAFTRWEEQNVGTAK